MWAVVTCQRNVQRIRRGKFQVPLPQTIAVVLWSAVISMLIAQSLDRWFSTLGFVVIAYALIAIALIDALTHRVPRYINGLAITLGAPLIILDAVIHWDLGNLLRAGAGSVALFALYAALGAASKGGFGKGDVLLAPIVGFSLAYVGWGTLAYGTIYTFVLAGLVSAVLLGTGRLARRDHIAFGPYIVAGMFLAIIF
jgi:leader peptidase (prepilin peptidase)/N-methyltransferase